MSVKQIPVFYFGHLFSVLNDHSVPLDGWLKEHNLNKNKLLQPGANISTEQFDALVREVLRKTELQHLGLLVGQRLHIAHHGAFGLGILNCKNIRQMIKFVQSYLVIRIPFIEISVYEEENELVVLANDAHWQDELHRFMIEAVSMAMLNLFLSLKQRHPYIQLKRLFFDFDEPEHHHKYQIFSPAKIEFNHGFSGLAFDLKWADYPIEDTDPTSLAQARQICELEKQQLSQNMSVAGRVRQIIMANSSEYPNLQTVANALHVSPRTLHRELNKENTSFKDVVEQFQAKKAREYLLAYGYPVNKVAGLLGYSDSANFRRAFKRWYGCAPSELQQQEQS
ncbi:AraC family transcriptional regulator [Glaciecola sp. XM2]|uniref:AraC family transcriptional regulator n=1 Tax=Glaciecola sp. XM2 TaxID=1914931 RepID=UPI001BDEA3C0|nr:AraC family transcriptional regulator [Glaciecola sp. XM2]MBT1449732.1 AraC family transcriptional regulator [Glaciecola sp. XM2]